MAKYIEKDAAIAALTEFRDDQTASKYLSIDDCLVARGAIERAIKMLESLPAADVEPVRHGRWVNFYGDFSTAECSLCAELYEVSCAELYEVSPEKELFDAFKEFSNFCPNCGAKMDGDG